MALLETPQAALSQKAPGFTLKNIDGTTLSLDLAKGKNGTVVAFICNHCPYVIAVVDRFVKTAKDLKSYGINTIAVMPNDTENYPADSFENMKIFAKENGFGFPYVIDETQEIAKAYGAVCTPDIFGLNKELEIQYRGRVDSAGKNAADNNTARELFDAMKEIAETGKTTLTQHPSMGCSIKWK